MQQELKTFEIWTPNSFGLGCSKIKAKDFSDAFKRLGKKDKQKDGWIEDENGDSKTFNQILGLEEN
jgi:hypothetical protein